MLYEKYEVYIAIKALETAPQLYALLDETFADYLDDEGLFSVEDYTVTTKGRAFTLDNAA